MFLKLKVSLLLASVMYSTTVLADASHQLGSNTPIPADSHAPIAVMGDHLHAKGEWMLSVRSMSMQMDGTIQGSHSINSDQIVTQISNPNAPPATVRVAPLKMKTDMQMLGLMYAPSDQLTLMAMLQYVEKSMNHLTYMGMMGSNRLGTFATKTSGLGDSKIAAVYGLFNDDIHQLHLNLGLSLPTGSIGEKDTVLTPMNSRVNLRVPYAMQLGSGTFDLEPGFTYKGKQGHLGWGAQYLATIRLGENSKNYTLGDAHKLSLWGNYRLLDGLSVSLRLTRRDEDRIDGDDEQITAPVTTANPASYGGRRTDLGLGVNWVGQAGPMRGQRLALEFEHTIDQYAHGVQLEMQDMLTLGWQYAF